MGTLQGKLPFSLPCRQHSGSAAPLRSYGMASGLCSPAWLLPGMLMPLGNLRPLGSESSPS